MTFKISPTVQLSIGLVLLTISILLVAQAIGLTPGINSNERLYARQKLAETIALQATIALKRNDRFFLPTMFNQIVEQTPSIRSLALRRSDTTVAYQTALHAKLWTLSSGSSSTPEEFRIPIVLDGVNQANLEITFTPLGSDNNELLGIPRFIWFIIFICTSGFLTFSIYLRRTLKHLDPSSVVPARVRNALNTMAEGVLILDKRTQVILANDAFVSRFERPETKLIGRNASKLGLSLENNSLHLPWELAQRSGQKQVKVRMRASLKGESAIFNVNSVPILDEKNRFQGTINSFDDITEIEAKTSMLQDMLTNLVDKQKYIEIKNQELHHLATRDPLTDCYNRRSLFERLEQHFKSKNTLHQEFCVIMLDIDHFKRINDTFGHNVGDVVIKGVCHLVWQQLGKHDMIARFGGEEFCVLLPECTTQRAQHLAEKCRSMIAGNPIDNIEVTASFGISTLAFGAQTPNEIILQADQALYASKNAGRNRCTLWSQALVKEDAVKSLARAD
ncbi:PAS domain S-box-containing protein/diguanylate cyclase (GGDEF)-like protein [Alteromonadaceae bacterium 2753L.S.0a.02]|nr:PAS domain S-box-containing protein/diguanylate cyclase (GGDEF)-like protein [Alteromonadaceae bacterium 2753L.S.0a.02]